MNAENVLKDPWILMALATVALCLLLALVLHVRRRRREEGFFEPLDLL